MSQVFDYIELDIWQYSWQNRNAHAYLHHNAKTFSRLADLKKEAY